MQTNLKAKKISDARQQSLNRSNNSSNQIKTSKCDTFIITQKNNTQSKSKTPSKSRKSKKTQKTKHLTINSRVRSLSLKFYPEQLLTSAERKKITKKDGRVDYKLWSNASLLEDCKSRLKKSILNFASAYATTERKDSKHRHHWQIASIAHDRDEVANEDDMFEPSAVKPHFHLILRDLNNNLFLVKRALDLLHLYYDKNKDSQLFFNGGAETVRDFNSYLLYLTHETEQAIRDGKEKYDISEIITNMSKAELHDLRAGYARVQKKDKLGDADWNKLANDVRDLGLHLKDFDDWTNRTLTFVQTTNSKFAKLQNLYSRSLQQGIEQYTNVTRCCILIHGIANDGKSYTSKHALTDILGLRTYTAHTGSGKYDGLRSYHQAIVFDDRNMSDALSVCDNSATVLHARGSGNDKAWTGSYVVCLTNSSPNEFFQSQGLKDSQIEALASRFYVCHITSDRRLILDYLHGNDSVSGLYASKRGTADDIRKRNEMFARFADAFNELIKNYHPLDADDAPAPADRFIDSTDRTYHVSHSNEYMTQEQYLATKKKIFDWLNDNAPSAEAMYILGDLKREFDRLDGDKNS